ncbi:MAG: efflux RND transporter periplasmic adaptor subunit [Victivallales bacterium]|nr:efflux RND transporter periplasmic adaptor subunit [Victivallales bacterium]
MGIRAWLCCVGWVTVMLAGCERNNTAPPPPPSVDVAPAVEGYVVNSSQIIGQAKADESVNLVARVKGFLTKRNFIEGAMVKKGELLFEIEKAQYQADVMSAKAALEKAQAALMNARTEFERQSQLLAKNATAKRTYDDAQARKMEAEAEVMDAQGQLDVANLNLSYTNIYSPFDGRVGLATYSVGNVVGPDSGKLANVIKLDPIRIAFNVSEVDILRLNIRREEQRGKPGKLPLHVRLRLVFQDGTVYPEEGRIGYSSNQINSSTGTLMVEALFPNKNYLIIPGMYVKVIIEDRRKTPALLIPQSAIMENLSGSFVMVVDKNNVVATKVIQTGLKKGASIQVVSGLKAGELVIFNGQQRVRKGSKVAPQLDRNYAEQAGPSVTSAVEEADNSGAATAAAAAVSMPSSTPSNSAAGGTATAPTPKSAAPVKK